ncbi:MAG TPA: L,D-transpeptidase [Candidatus Methylacidiphilales bacterium]
MKESTQLRSLILSVSGIVLGLFIWANVPVDPLPQAVRAARIEIDKGKHTLTLVDEKGQPIKVYRVALGRAGKRLSQYDGKTPEGNYFVQETNPQSTYHMSLALNYPSKEDMVEAAQQGAQAGGVVAIQGIKNGWSFLGRAHRFYDWTDGSISVTNTEIEEILRAVPRGTPVAIWE